MTSSARQSILSLAQYEPEGVYLTLPLLTETRILQFFGAFPAYHAQFTYNNVPLKGHPGLDLAAAPGADIVAADAGRVMEIGNEVDGFGRYLKIEHRWGESFYAALGEILVESGQLVVRGQILARTAFVRKHAFPPHLHFAIRIRPYNRFDGWGGFCDPLPYLVIEERTLFDYETDAEEDSISPELPTLRVEQAGVRRP